MYDIFGVWGGGNSVGKPRQGGEMIVMVVRLAAGGGDQVVEELTKER